MANPRQLASPTNNQNHLGIFNREVASSELTPMESPLQIISPYKSAEESDGENVIQDEGELQSKAFEARVSQWNRKLSIKQHSEEKE